MGSYGIGPGRVLAAAVEQHHDEDGIVWPAELAPYDVHVVALARGAERSSSTPSEVGGAARGAGLDVLLDDRELRPGEKFADADLIGCPVADHRRQEDARGRRGRRPRPRDRRGGAGREFGGRQIG